MFKLTLDTKTGDLLEDGEPIMHKEWAADKKDFPNIFPPNQETGMYSAILEVYDVAGNQANARTLILYDPTSEISLDSAQPLLVESASPETNYTWLTTLKNDQNTNDVKVSWKNHFINKEHIAKSLLISVGTFNYKQIKLNYDDDDGNRTREAVPNSLGITECQVGKYRDHQGALDAKKPESWGPKIGDLAKLDNDILDIPRIDGDSIKIFVRCYDVVGHMREDTRIFNVDSTPPVVHSAKFTKNGAKGSITYGSR